MLACFHTEVVFPKSVFCQVFTVLCFVSRPGETAAGLLLHRHLLPQQHLCVCVLLLPARVTVCSPPLLPAKDQGNKVVFLANSTRKKKKPQNKSQLWLFPLCHAAASKPAEQSVSILPRERRWRQAVTVIAKAPSSLVCNALSGGTPQRLQKKDPHFLY